MENVYFSCPPPADFAEILSQLRKIGTQKVFAFQNAWSGLEYKKMEWDGNEWSLKTSILIKTFQYLEWTIVRLATQNLS